ncbi:MAG: hypothetical protein JNJ60_22225, partial [Rhodocyclaceae bacterium]|nr:hypothetical protein [Rhodocyclaceae bacterium]
GSGITLRGYGFIGDWSNGQTFTNAGSIVADVSGQTWTLSPATFTNLSGGSVSATAGNLTLTPTTLNLNSGGTVQVAGGAITINPANTWSNGGTINLSSGALNLGSSITLASLGSYNRSGGAVNLTGTLDLGGGTLNVGSAGPFGTGGLSSVTGSNATIRNGTIVSSDASPVLTAVSNPNFDAVTLANGANPDLTVNGSIDVFNGITLGGTINKGNSTWWFNGAGTVALGGSGTLVSAGGALYSFFSPANGQTIQLGSGITLRGYGFIGDWSSGQTFVNAGAIVADVAGQTWTINPATFTNQSGASIAVESGAALALNGSNLNLGGTVYLAGGTLNRSVANLNIPSGTALNGYGNINTGSFALVNNGSINVGDNGVPSIGLLTVTGNFTQSSGTLVMELGGRVRGVSYDALDVSGTASLGGTLNVLHTGGFTPGTLETFHLVRANSRSGTFATVNQPGSYNALYGSASMMLALGVSGINEWISNSSGTWDTAGNWSQGHAPTGTEIAVLDRGNAANPTITVNTTGMVAGAVSSWEILNISSGSLAVSGPFTQTGQTLTVSGGALSAGGGNIQVLNMTSGSATFTGAVAVGQLFQTAGTLGGAGTLTLTGTGSSWTGGSGAWTGGGTVRVASGADLTLSGSGTGN